MTEPKVVTPAPDLLESTAHLVMRTAGLLDPVRLQAWEELGITLAQLRILFRVRALPGADVRRIAADIGITPSAVSQQVDKLVQRGLLLRRDKPEDRRYVQLELTETGQEATGHINQIARERVRALLAVLDGADLADLGRLLEKLLDQELTWPKPEPAKA